MIHERLALDAQSVRRYDNNGNLHVAVSHLTKAQVRPYYGSEIIGWQRLKLEPTKVYYGYAPPEELSKPETVESTNGIPIQLDHHPDYADDPQLKTRVGSTGTDGAFREPYLDNSLHITVENAIRRILDGSMRELSLAYSYTPDFTSGKTPDGDPYDFIMRDISANHVALVEQGRAGRDVLVQDSQLKEVGPMDDKEKTTPATDGDPAVEKKEVALARAIGEAAKGIEDLHTQDQEGNVIDKPEDARSFLGALKDLAYNPDEAQDGDEDMAEGADDELEQADGAEPDDCEQIVQDGLKACGYDAEPEELQRAFAEGVRYGEKKEKAEPEKLDREHEREGEERDAEGSAKRIERRIMNRFAAMDECAKTLGKVRANAYDSAESVYLAALRQEGVNTKGVSPQAARAAYRAFMAGKSRARKGSFAQDSASRQKSNLLVTKLSQIKKGY